MQVFDNAWVRGACQLDHIVAESANCQTTNVRASSLPPRITLCSTKENSKACRLVRALRWQVCLQFNAFGLQHGLIDVELDIVPVNFNVLMVQGDCVFQCVL
jgi:hypothetical protein